MDYNSEEGYLELIYGPMKSGKTSLLLQLYKQFKFCEVQCMVINHEKDKGRYSESCLSNHDKNMIPCDYANNLTSLVSFAGNSIISGTHIDEFLKSKVILINEAQFFEDIVEWVTTATEIYKKKVYICGLNNDFKRKAFGNWLDLLLICDKVTPLKSWCSVCRKNQALFSHRLTAEQDKIVIGVDNYIPLCRTCWLKLNV